MAEIPEAVWSGEFTLAGVALKCHVLGNGQRIIEQESFNQFFAALAGGASVDPEAMQEFAAWQKGR